MTNAYDAYQDPNAVVSADWLKQHLGDARVRVIDCTTHLRLVPAGSDVPYIAEPGRAEYDAGHIPGAVFLDLANDLSAPHPSLNFMCPDAEHFARAIGALGVGDGDRVVIYSTTHMMWATRLWWMFRAFGFDNAAVLDGGLKDWQAAGGALSTEPGHYPPASFTATPRPGFFVGAQEVKAAIDAPNAVTVNALNPEFHIGETPSRYGRPGRVPGSVNVPAATVLENENSRFLGLDVAKAQFDAQGITPDKHVIVYCGGGISATVDLFLMHQLGFKDLTLYDASMGEWAKDESLPIEQG